MTWMFSLGELQMLCGQRGPWSLQSALFRGLVIIGAGHLKKEQCFYIVYLGWNACIDSMKLSISL